jgi:hypothetical protein
LFFLLLLTLLVTLFDRFRPEHVARIAAETAMLDTWRRMPGRLRIGA